MWMWEWIYEWIEYLMKREWIEYWMNERECENEFIVRNVILNEWKNLLMNTILNEWMWSENGFINEYNFEWMNAGLSTQGGRCWGSLTSLFGYFFKCLSKKSLIALEGSQEFLTVNSIGSYFKDSILL